MNKISNFTNYSKSFFNYQLKKTVCSHYPIMVWIEPTSYCNLKCPMCPNTKLASSQTGYMPVDRFKKVVDDVSQFANSISICHRGEPLLNNNLCEMIEYCSVRGINTNLHTNATMLNKELSRRLIESGLSFISFSFDGYTKEAYESIRVGARFDKVLKNIQQFLRVKKDMRSRAPHTSIQVIDFQQLRDAAGTEEKRKFIRMFEGLPLDRLYIKPVHNWAGDAERGENGRTGHEKDMKTSRCNSPWYALVVHWDGSVYTCCLDYMGKYPLGNVRDESLMEIWNGTRMVRLRSEMNAGEFDECTQCVQCDKLFEKKFFGVSTENLFNETLFRIRWNLGLI